MNDLEGKLSAEDIRALKETLIPIALGGIVPFISQAYFGFCDSHEITPILDDRRFDIELTATAFPIASMAYLKLGRMDNFDMVGNPLKQAVYGISFSALFQAAGYGAGYAAGWLSKQFT